LAVVDKLKELGATVAPVELPKFPVGALDMILSVEAASAFEELTRTGRDDELAVQENWGWPTTFRKARFVPAVEFIQANRIRYQMIQELAKLFKDIDVFVSPSFAGDCNTMSNQTGYPCVVVPNGMRGAIPGSVSFIGNLFGEAKALEVARVYQEATDFHQHHPDMSKVVP
jgi:Asp-tRNA(Asn)/Glu-tRNA(Gln) amidotransferase A subunit family amidase